MITVISGTSRRGNNTSKIARHVAGLHEQAGEEVCLLDLCELPEEAFTPEIFGDKPVTLTASFTDKVLHADGLVVAIPEYNGSFPGVLKHFVDLLPFPEAFDCRPVAFIGLAAGYHGALRAVEHMQMVFAYRNAYLYNRRVFIPAVHKVLNEEGAIIDEALLERLETQAGGFRSFIQALQQKP